MAIPFQDSCDSEAKKNEVQKKNNKKASNMCSGAVKRAGNSPRTNIASAQGTSASATIYCVPNSTFFRRGPTFINASIIHKGLISCKGKVEKVETGSRIKVRKGIFDSCRTITSEDIRLVAAAVGEDWKKLVKKLPGVTNDNLSFHQAFIDAMDRGDSTNMAEIALNTWKSELSELSTVGNLSKTLFCIGHPEIVSHLKP